MRRHVSVLLLAVAGFLPAAPTPFPRSGPWFDGWDQPVDKAGTGKFVRQDQTLTMTVSGKPYRIGGEAFNLNGPHMLRDVEGDFLVQVWVRGDFRPALSGFQRAGILLTDGETRVRVERMAGNDVVDEWTLNYPSLCIETNKRGVEQSFKEGPLVEEPACLRVERRGNVVAMEFKEVSTEWTRFGTLHIEAPRKIKVGVIGQATSEGTFKVVFDGFKLTRLPAAK